MANETAVKGIVLRELEEKDSANKDAPESENGQKLNRNVDVPAATKDEDDPPEKAR